MTLLGEEFVLDGQKIDTDIFDRITGARLIGTMEGAASIELDVWDGDGELLTTGRLATRTNAKKGKLEDAAWARFGAMRLVFDGTLWRLAGVSGFRTLTLTFEDETASLVRRHTRAMTSSRGSKTRAEFIGLAASKVKEIAVVYRSPEEGVKQNIKAPKDNAEAKGISPGAHLTVKGVAATSEQRKNMETVLAVADRLQAGDRATLALIVACTVEGVWHNVAGGTGTSQGILQVTRETAAGITPRTVIDPRGQVHGAVTHDASGPIAPGNLDPRDMKECARVFLLRGFAGKGGAIKYAADNPDAEVYAITQAVQGSGAGLASNGQANYGPWVEEAKKILDAWGGVGQVTTLRESFQFRIGGKLKKDDLKNENYWAGFNRLAGEVDGWRLFAWRNVLSFVSDEWLFGRKPAFVIDRDQVYVKDRDADTIAPVVDIQIGQVDVGITLSELTVKAPARRWDAGPGQTVELVDLGPISGKWLVWENRFDLQRDRTELTLRRPAPKGPEPAPNTTSTLQTESRPASGSFRQLIVAAAKKANKQQNRYRYEQIRPYPPSLFPTDSVSILHIDCSAFVTLCYKTAGVSPDPNGLGYNGSGYTGTLAANGKRTSDPQPGDLVFYGSGPPYGHVAIYIGGGKVIGMGGTPGPLELDVKYRSDFAGYWTYQGVDS